MAGGEVKTLLTLLVLALLCTSSPQAQDTRFFYVTPVDGSGTETDPYRSRCLTLTGKGNIDLRPYGWNRFLCASNALPSDMTGVQQLGSSLLDNLTPARKQALETLIGRSLTGLTVREVIIEILQARLKPGRDGKLKIWLGRGEPVYQQTAGIPFRDHGLFADVALGAVHIASLIEEYTLGATIAWATTLATETFTASDGNLDTCSCVHDLVEIGTDWTISSNTALGSGASGGNGDFFYVNSTLATTNHAASFTVVSMTTASGSTSVAAMVRKPGNSDLTCYRNSAVLRTSGELNETSLVKQVHGVGSTTLDSDTTDWATSDIIGVSVDGTTVTGTVNGTIRTQATDTDAALDPGDTTLTYVGARYFSDNAGNSAAIDNLNGADNESSFGPLRRRAL